MPCQNQADYILSSETQSKQLGLFVDHENSVEIDGSHYELTSNMWLQRLYANANQIKIEFGAVDGWKQLQRWRLFYLGVAECFGWRKGKEWHVVVKVIRRRRRTIE